MSDHPAGRYRCFTEDIEGALELAQKIRAWQWCEHPAARLCLIRVARTAEFMVNTGRSALKVLFPLQSDTNPNFNARAGNFLAPVSEFAKAVQAIRALNYEEFEFSRPQEDPGDQLEVTTKNFHARLVSPNPSNVMDLFSTAEWDQSERMDISEAVPTLHAVANTIKLDKASRLESGWRSSVAIVPDAEGRLCAMVSDGYAMIEAHRPTETKWKPWSQEALIPVELFTVLPREGTLAINDHSICAQWQTKGLSIELLSRCYGSKYPAAPGFIETKLRNPIYWEAFLDPKPLAVVLATSESFSNLAKGTTNPYIQVIAEKEGVRFKTSRSEKGVVDFTMPGQTTVHEQKFLNISISILTRFIGSIADWEEIHLQANECGLFAHSVSEQNVKLSAYLPALTGGAQSM